MNMLAYGSDEPPEIKVSKIKKTNIVLYVGKRDKLATLEDSEWLENEVSAVVERIEIDSDHTEFNHMNDQSFFSGLIDRIDKYEKL